MAEKTEELIEDKAVVTKGIDTVTGDEDKKDIEKVSEIENIEVPKEEKLPEPEKEVEPIETDPIEETETPKEEFRKESLDFPTAIDYREPKTKKELKESFISDVGSNLATKGTSSIEGFKGSIRTDILDALYEPLNLTEAIPDARERERFKTYNQDKLVDLFGDSVGITFQNDADDMFKFKEKQYHHLTKRFIDELDENEGFMEEAARTATSFVGSTLVATAGNLLGMVWGAGTSLLRLDSDYMFNNMVYDGLEYVQEGIDKNFVTYGGSDPYNSVYNEETGTWNFEQKPFVARFISDPFKSINSDIVPAAAFVASAVVSEIIAGAFTAGTGGLASASQAGLTARLAYRGGQLFNKATKLNMLSKANRLNKFSKTNKILRGLDNAPGIKGAEINKMASTYRKGIGTLSFAFRTSAYESALIARDTEEATLNKILTNYHIEKGGTITDQGIILDKDGNQLQELIAPSALELEKFKEAASSAATTAYFMNVPLVAGSHFIQFGNVFRKNYQIARKASTSVGSEARSIFNKTRLGGVRYKNGKWQANVDSNKWLKGLGYSGTILAKPITEGFEEFAQGGIQEGLVDYYAENYSSSSRRHIVGMLDSIVKRSAAYANTTEGQDSMTIGALMGLLGIRLPIRMNAQTGKYAFSLRGQAFGGSRQAYKQAKQKVKDAKKTAEILNSQGEVEYSPMLQQRLQNHVRYANSQGNKEEAAFENDTYTFKNEEHKQFVSGIYSRVKEGLGDTFSQEFEGLEKMSLEKFNELYGVKGEEFTEKTKKESIEKAKKETQEVLDAIDLVENTLNEQAPDLLQKTFKKLTGKELFPGIKIDTNLLSEGFKEQMAYLYSTVQNTNKREKELSQRINNLLDKEGGASLNLNALDDVVTEIVGLNLNTQKAEFRNNADKIKKEILSEWKKSNPNNFRLYNKEVSNLLDDILKLKIRKGEAAKMYESLFTEKGAEHFSNLQAALEKAAAKEDVKNARKKVEKDVKKARNKGAMSNANAADFSVNGNNDIASQKVTKDVLKGIQEIEDLENIPNVSEEAKQKKLMQILDKNPGLLATVIERLEEKGISMKNVKTAKPIQLAGIETINLVLEELEKLKLEVKEAIETGVFEADRNDQLDQTETASPEEIIEEAEQEGFKKSLSTSNWFTFVNITDKRGSYVSGEGYKFVRGNDGKYVKVDINGAEISDPNLLNSPDFLNTEYLENNPTYFEFRISNKEQEESSDKIDIDVIYKDPKTKKEVFIGRLFKAGKNSPQQLKDLREEIVKREKTPADTTIKEKANRIQEIKKEKEVIKKKLQENLDAKKEALESPTQLTAEVTEEEFKEFTDNATVSDERINAIVNKIKAGTELTTQEQAMREEKAEQIEKALKEDTTTELDAEQAELKSQLNDLNEELKNLAGDITIDYIPETGEKNIFVDIKTIENTENKKLKKEKKKELEEGFEEKSINRANFINNNFQDIIAAIETSGIQIFLDPKTNKHKNC